MVPVLTGDLAEAAVLASKKVRLLGKRCAAMGAALRGAARGGAGHPDAVCVARGGGTRHTGARGRRVRNPGGGQEPRANSHWHQGGSSSGCSTRRRRARQKCSGGMCTCDHRRCTSNAMIAGSARRAGPMASARFITVIKTASRCSSPRTGPGTGCPTG